MDVGHTPNSMTLTEAVHWSQGNPWRGQLPKTVWWQPLLVSRKQEHLCREIWEVEHLWVHHSRYKGGRAPKVDSNVYSLRKGFWSDSTKEVYRKNDSVLVGNCVWLRELSFWSTEFDPIFVGNYCSVYNTIIMVHISAYAC